MPGVGASQVVSAPFVFTFSFSVRLITNMSVNIAHAIRQAVMGSAAVADVLPVELHR